MLLVINSFMFIKSNALYYSTYLLLICKIIIEVAGPSGCLAVLPTAFPVLAALLRDARAAEASEAAGGQASLTPPWRIVYATSKAFERVVAVAAPSVHGQLEGCPTPVELFTLPAPVAPVASAEEAPKESPRKGKAKLKAAEKAEEAPPAAPAAAPTPEGPAPEPVPAPKEALSLLWRHMLGGSEAFVDEGRHPWSVAVALRILEAQLSRCESLAQAEAWFGGRTDAGAEPEPVTAACLVGRRKRSRPRAACFSCCLEP